MPRGTVSFRIQSPAEVVFDYLSDLENAPQWASALSSIAKASDGEVAVGTRYTGRVLMADRAHDAELDVVELERPRAFAYAARGGPAQLDARFLLTPDGDGTRVEHLYQVKLSGFARMYGAGDRGHARDQREGGDGRAAQGGGGASRLTVARPSTAGAAGRGGPAEGLTGAGPTPSGSSAMH